MQSFFFQLLPFLGIRNNEIQNILEMAIQEEKYMRQEQMEDMKRSWNQSKNDKGKINFDISPNLRDTYGFCF